eukprot:4614078-Prymnesium_polylepis.1
MASRNAVIGASVGALFMLLLLFVLYRVMHAHQQKRRHLATRRGSLGWRRARGADTDFLTKRVADATDVQTIAFFFGARTISHGKEPPLREMDLSSPIAVLHCGVPSADKVRASAIL